jgi:hypothetical protein
MEEKLKRVTSRHDKIIKLNEQVKILDKDRNDLKSKVEKDYYYFKSFLSRIIDLKINNYDKIIDFEIFILKLFVPVLSISFVAGISIFGIDTNTLKYLSLGFIICDVFLLMATFSSRTKLITSEKDRIEREVDSFDKRTASVLDDITNRADLIKQEVDILIEEENTLENESPSH